MTNTLRANLFFKPQLLHTSQTEEAHFYYVHQIIVTYLCQTQIHFTKLFHIATNNIN